MLKNPLRAVSHATLHALSVKALLTLHVLAVSVQPGCYHPVSVCSNVQMAIMEIPRLVNVNHATLPVKHVQEGQCLIVRPAQILVNLYMVENVYPVIRHAFDADGKAQMAV